MSPSPPTDLGAASLPELVAAAGAEPAIDAATRALLLERSAAGDAAAIEILVRSNLRVVLDEAIRLRGRGESQSSMVRRGVHALADAVATYDPARHGEFTAHVAERVRGAIRRSRGPN